MTQYSAEIKRDQFFKKKNRKGKKKKAGTTFTAGPRASSSVSWPRIHVCKS